MKLKISLLTALTVLAFGVQSLAADCYLSSDCGDGEICINLECAAPDDTMDSCDSDDECNHLFVCTDGICLPEGVYCKSDTGFGVLTATGSTLECGGGLGRVGISTASSSGSSSDMACDDDGDCSLPSVTELTPAELQELYDRCVNDMESNCGTEVPVPEDECSPGALQICSDWFTFGENKLEECEDVFEAMYEESHPDDNTDITDGTVSPPSIGGDSDVDGDGDIDDGVGDEDWGDESTEETETSGDADAAPQISGLFSFPGLMRGLAAETNPWQMVECCDAFDESETEAEAEMLTEVTACFIDNEGAGCAALYDCIEPMFDYFDYDDRIAMSGSDDMGGDGQQEKSDKNTADDDESDDSAEDADGEGTGNNNSDSGCSITAPGSTIGSVFSLLF